MGNILIAMPKRDDANRIGDIIRRSDIWIDPIISSSGSETLQMVRSREVSLVICTKKLRDMGYEELSSYMPVSANMILLTQDANLIPFSSNVTRILMPFKIKDLTDTIKLLLPELKERPKLKKPKRSLEDQKIIDEAKALLMEKNDMTEPDAFRYIQKNSMDSGRTMLESAQMILMMSGKI